MSSLILMQCSNCGRDTWDYLEYADEALCDRCDDSEEDEWDGY